MYQAIAKKLPEAFEGCCTATGSAGALDAVAAAVAIGVAGAGGVFGSGIGSSSGWAIVVGNVLPSLPEEVAASVCGRFAIGATGHGCISGLFI